MIIETQFKVGPVLYKLTFDEKDEMEAMHKAIVLGNPPQYCTLCKNSQFFALATNKGNSEKGTFTYVKVKCKKCGAESTLGQHKAGGYFWKKFEKWEGMESSESHVINPEIGQI